MKRYILLLLACLTLLACQKPVRTPYAAATVDTATVKIHQSIQFTFTGTADQVVVFTGDTGHVYEHRNYLNTGVVLNKNVYTHSYSAPGYYHVVFVASCYDDLATHLTQDTCGLYIHVVDDDCAIYKISCNQVLYDEIAARQVNDSDWLVVLPQKVVYNNVTGTISASQKLAIELGSDSSRVTINGQPYKNTAKYNLSNPVQLHVTSHEGNYADYMLHMLRYPEFASFMIGDSVAVLRRNEYDYTQMSMTLCLPDATDLTQLVPTYTLAQAQRVCYHGQDYVPGTPIDFSEPVVFTLVNTADYNPAFQATTDIIVTITHPSKR